MRFDKLLFLSVAVMVACAVAASTYRVEPRVMLISLDAATPRPVRELMRDGAIPRDREPGAPVRRPLDGG